MFDRLVDSPVTYTSTNYLLQTLQHFNNQEFATGKVHWLRQFPNFDFSVSATVNVWGSEQDMIMPCLAEILQSTQETICDTADCPQKKKVHDSKGIFIVSTCEEKKDGENKFQAVIKKWLGPEKQKCGMRFNQNPPLTAQVRMSEPSLAIPDN